MLRQARHVDHLGAETLARRDDDLCTREFFALGLLGDLAGEAAVATPGSGKSSDRGRERELNRAKEMAAPVVDPIAAEGAKSNRATEGLVAGEKARIGTVDG